MAKMVIEAEAGLLAGVQHPNVVTIIGYRYDEEEQQAHPLTEPIETNLQALIHRHMSQRFGSPFTLLGSIDVLLQIAETMIHVHECSVTHRDLKALSCLVTRETRHCTVKLIDFGSLESPNQQAQRWAPIPRLGTLELVLGWHPRCMTGKGMESTNTHGLPMVKAFDDFLRDPHWRSTFRYSSRSCIDRDGICRTSAYYSR